MSSSTTDVLNLSARKRGQKSDNDFYSYKLVRIPKDAKAALEFIEKLKTESSAAALRALRVMGGFYSHQHGTTNNEEMFPVPRNSALAFELYKFVAESPVLSSNKLIHYPSLTKEQKKEITSYYNGDACQDLGICYYYGEGTARNCHAAVQWYHSAMVLNSDKSMFNVVLLGLINCYMFGIGLPKNIHRAILLTQFFEFTISFERVRAAKNHLPELYKLAPDFPQVQIPLTEDFDHKSAFETTTIQHYIKLAEQGNVVALNLMGFAHEHGIGCEQSLNLALKYYRAAVDKGDFRCLIDLHRCLHQLPPACPLKAEVPKMREALKPSEFLKLAESCLARIKDTDIEMKAHILFMLGDFFERNLLGGMFNTFQASQCYHDAWALLKDDDSDIQRKNDELLPIWAMRSAIAAAAPSLNVGKPSLVDLVTEYAFDESNYGQDLDAAAKAFNEDSKLRQEHKVSKDTVKMQNP